MLWSSGQTGAPIGDVTQLAAALRERKLLAGMLTLRGVGHYQSAPAAQAAALDAELGAHPANASAPPRCASTGPLHGHDGDITQGADYASTMLQQLPAAYRPVIVPRRAHAVADAIPAARRAAPVVRALHEVLAISAEPVA